MREDGSGFVSAHLVAQVSAARWIDGLRTRNFVTRRVLDDYERLFKRARVRERIDEGVRAGRTTKVLTNAVPTRSITLVHRAGASAGR